MMENEETYNKIVNYSATLMDKYFPKGQCQERSKVLMFNAELIAYAMQEIEKAENKGFLNGIFGKDTRTLTDKIEHLEYLHSVGEISDEEFNEYLLHKIFKLKQ